MEYRKIQKEDELCWLAMRNQMWPEEPVRNNLEVTEYFSDSCSAISCVFMAVNTANEIVGFIELSIRSHAHGSQAFKVPYVEACEC